MRWFLGALAVVLLQRQLLWAALGSLNVDEFEEVQVLWLIEQGIWPYRDFLHTHLPVYHLLLWPIYAAIGPAVELPGLVRLVFFPVVVGIVFLVGWIARIASNNTHAGWLAVVLFLTSARIGGKLAEIRPDSFGLLLALLGLAAGISYLQRPAAAPRLRLAAGALLGLSLLFSQKALFLIFVLLWVIERSDRHALGLRFWRRLRRFVGLGVLILSPFVLVVVVLFAAGVMRGSNLPLFLTNGLFHMTSAFLVQYKNASLATFFLANVVVVLIGLRGVFRLRGTKLAQLVVSRPGLLLLGTYSIVGIVQVIAMPIVVDHLFILPFVALSILAAWILSTARARTQVLAVVSTLLFTHVVDPMDFWFRTEQMEQAHFVQETVGEGVPVLDSFSGYGIFRPIAGRFVYYRPAMHRSSFYESQNRIVEEMLEKGEFGAVIDLEMLDHAPARVRELVVEGYQPSAEHPQILLPKGG